MKKSSKYFHISSVKEESDTGALLDIIKASKWVDSSTILVNCSPDYSSTLTQQINHKLSYLNKNELFEVINMEMPYPTGNQVWDNTDKIYLPFDSYLKKWMMQVTANKYLFIDSGTLRGKNFNKVRLALNSSKAEYRFASLYVQDDSIFTPDYYVEKFNKQEKGGLLFYWENADNPNWDY